MFKFERKLVFRDVRKKKRKLNKNFSAYMPGPGNNNNNNNNNGIYDEEEKIL